MTFEERKREALAMVSDFLAGYSPPRGVSDDGLSRKVAEIADAFARRMPVGDHYAEKIGEVFRSIRDTHISGTWPTQAVFVAAMPFDPSKSRSKSPETYHPDDALRSAAEKMNSGEAVSDLYVWGEQSNKIQAKGYVSAGTMESYRRGSVEAFKKVYGADAEMIARSKYGDGVWGFFE